ncbi:MAG: HD-GYP domain-containing protein [Planctomycetota bacterium]|nr:HD-GYP domain-containing protein [Planctomycetota bacterium]
MSSYAQDVDHDNKPSASARHPAEPSSSRTTPSGPGFDGAILARLIRRLRVSEAPERFQTLALGAARSMLDVAAAAWVPSQYQEKTIVAGEVEGLAHHDFSSFVTPAADRLTLIDNQPGNPLVARLAAVAAEHQGAGGWLIVVNPRNGRAFGRDDIALLEPIVAAVVTQHANARLYADLKELLFGVIRALTSAIDAKDPYTSGHSERVARIAVRIGEQLGLTPNQRGDLYLMGLLHDVGKIGIDDSVLKKTGPLTPDEYRLIQSHVVIGVHILEDLKKLRHLLPGVRHHHESLDGTGYPDKLSGSSIPFEARILAVADAFDAMSSTRPYRRKLSFSQISEIFLKGSGVQWDSKVVDALIACRSDLELIRQKGLGESLQVVVNDTLGRA